MIMYIGHIILAIAIIFILLGFADNYLKKVGISKTAAIIFGLLILAGLIAPAFRIGDILIISVGGFLLPLAGCIILLTRAGSAWEVIRTLISAIIIGSIAANLIYFFPIHSELTYVDFSLFLGVLGGAIAYLIGRSRRSAFVSAALGTMFISLFEYNIYWTQGYEYVLIFGSLPLFSATVIASLIALVFAEWAGETAEYSQTGNTDVDYFNIDKYINQQG